MFRYHHAIGQSSLAAGLGLLLVVPIGPAAAQGTAATEPESSQSIIAAQIRRQGYQCHDPKSAERDSKDSKPDEAAWLLDCGNATYRVRLKPGMAADVKAVN